MKKADRLLAIAAFRKELREEVWTRYLGHRGWESFRESSARPWEGGQSRNRIPETIQGGSRQGDTTSLPTALKGLSRQGSELPTSRTCCLLPLIFIDQTKVVWFSDITRLRQLIDQIQGTCAGHSMNTGSFVFTADRTEYQREKDLGFLITWRLLVASDLAEICRIDQSMFGKGNPKN